jgi:hypothetical protein
MRLRMRVIRLVRFWDYNDCGFLPSGRVMAEPDAGCEDVSDEFITQRPASFKEGPSDSRSFLGPT